MKKHVTGRTGFTLIELLVVIAIIGLLSTVAVVSLNSARGKARDAKRIADVKSIQTALEMYYNDCSAYPSSLSATAACGSMPTLLTPVPADPTNTGVNVYTYATATGGYTLTFSLEGSSGSLASGAHTASPAGIQ